MLDDDHVSALRRLIDALARRPSADLGMRMRSLAEDLARIRDGTAPTAEDLATAPRLESWAIGVRDGAPVLIGKVARHPVLGDRPIVTSCVWALDPHRTSWARTLSRWYALGTPAQAVPQPPKIRSKMQ